MLPLIKGALAKESDPQVKALLAQARAALEIKHADPTVRREAAKLLGESDNPQAKQILLALQQQNPDGTFYQPDPDVRAEGAESYSGNRASIAASSRLSVICSAA